MSQGVYGLLGNRLNVVMIPRPETSAIAVWILTRGGSDYENAGNNGVNHFLEHMYFKGTKKRRTPLEIWRAIEGRGGEINAQTDRECVGYGVEMGGGNLEFTLELLSDILFNSRFDPEDIKLESGVIMEEKMGVNDVPQAELYELWDKLLYPDSPWGFPVEGSAENIKNMTREKLMACLEEHYRSNLMVLAVAGKINPEETMLLANKYFSRAKKGKKPLVIADTERQGSQQRISINFRETEQTHLILGVTGYSLFHPLKCAFELLGIILGGNGSSRLFTTVRGENGLAYDIRTHNHLFTNRGELATYAGVNHSNVEKTIRAITKEYKKTAAGEITAEELECAKEYVLGRMSRFLEGSSSLAIFFGLKKLFSEPNQTPEEEMEAMKRVSLKDLQLVAQDIFKKEKFRLVVLGPHKGARQLEKLLIS